MAINGNNIIIYSNITGTTNHKKGKIYGSNKRRNVHC